MSQSHTVTSSDGASIHVTCDGNPDNPAITFGHSLGASGEMWSPQVRRLQDQFYLIRVDFRGHGKSGVPAGPYSFCGLARDVVAVWDTLRVETSGYVGLSLGGVVGAALALEFPRRVNSLLLSSCRFNSTPAYRLMWAERIELLARGGMPELATSTIASWLTLETRATQKTLTAQLKNLLLTTDPDGWLAMVAAFQDFDYKKSLCDIRIPTTLVCGERDPVLGEMRECANLFRDAELIELPAAAHICNYDQPEIFAELIEAAQNERGFAAHGVAR